MGTYYRAVFCGFLSATTLVGLPAAHAADGGPVDGGTHVSSVETESPENSVILSFRLGLQAYKKGQKDEAFEAYRAAADQGHSGARWKLAHMYAEGDGTPEDDYRAFQLFEEIVQEGATPGSREQAFIANALVSLAGYFQAGIPGTPVEPDPMRARDLYWLAATNFGEPHAQFEIGLYHLGDGSNRNGQRQAARWFNQAAQKGHAGAKAMLGKLYFQSGRTVAGLALLTEALEIAAGSDRMWIRGLQEGAFAVSSEGERRKAVSMVESRLASK
ncbi:MAG: tetratricopeptide repeat protein [Pseudomonadota bacterium]